MEKLKYFDQEMLEFALTKKWTVPKLISYAYEKIKRPKTLKVKGFKILKSHKHLFKLFQEEFPQLEEWFNADINALESSDFYEMLEAIETFAEIQKTQKASNGQTLKVDISKSKIRYFNSWEDLEEILDEEKIAWLKHKAINKIVIGAKDAGKTYAAILYILMVIESNPLASVVTLRKNKDQATMKIRDNIENAIVELKQRGFSFKADFASSGRRLYSKENDDNKKNNYISFSSFDDLGDASGTKVSNGGFIKTTWVEEPLEKEDAAKGRIPSEETWNSNQAIISSSIGRTVFDYNELHNEINPDHVDVEPMQRIYTLNDWDKHHPISKQAEKIFPRNIFMRKNLAGFDLNYLLGHRERILKNWDAIVEALLTNHTQMVYYESNDPIKDTLVVRTTSLAKPANRRGDALKGKLEKIQTALIENVKYDLAAELGLAYDASGDYVHMMNPLDIEKRVIDTQKYLKDNKDVFILGHSIGWDIDVSRRLVMSNLVITAKVVDDPNPLVNQSYMFDLRLLLLPQIEVPKYSIKDKDEGTKIYQESIFKLTKEYLKKYKPVVNQFNTYTIIDDNQGAWVRSLKASLELEWESNPIDHPPFVDKQLKKGANFDTEGRSKEIQMLLDTKTLFIDKSNEELIDFYMTVPRNPANNKRLEKGHYEVMADTANSFEASLYPWQNNLVTQLIRDEAMKVEKII